MEGFIISTSYWDDDGEGSLSSGETTTDEVKHVSDGSATTDELTKAIVKAQVVICAIIVAVSYLLSYTAAFVIWTRRNKYPFSAIDVRWLIAGEVSIPWVIFFWVGMANMLNFATPCWLTLIAWDGQLFPVGCSLFQLMLYIKLESIYQSQVIRIENEDDNNNGTRGGESIKSLKLWSITEKLNRTLVSWVCQTRWFWKRRSAWFTGIVALFYSYFVNAALTVHARRLAKLPGNVLAGSDLSVCALLDKDCAFYELVMNSSLNPLILFLMSYFGLKGFDDSMGLRKGLVRSSISVLFANLPYTGYTLLVSYGIISAEDDTTYQIYSWSLVWCCLGVHAITWCNSVQLIRVSFAYARQSSRLSQTASTSFRSGGWLASLMFGGERRVAAVDAQEEEDEKDQAQGLPGGPKAQIGVSDAALLGQLFPDIQNTDSFGDLLKRLRLFSTPESATVLNNMHLSADDSRPAAWSRQFQKHLAGEFCSENLAFIWFVADYQQTFDLKIRAKIGGEILQRYVKSGSLCELNISDSTKTLVVKEATKAASLAAAKITSGKKAGFPIESGDYRDATKKKEVGTVGIIGDHVDASIYKAKEETVNEIYPKGLWSPVEREVLRLLRDPYYRFRSVLRENLKKKKRANLALSSNKKSKHSSHHGHVVNEATTVAVAPSVPLAENPPPPAPEHVTSRVLPLQNEQT